MRKWDVLIAATVWGTFAATFTTAVLLFSVWREVRLVLHALNGRCMP